MSPRVIRVDPEVRAALDRIRDRYGDPNYSVAIRRVLRWHRIVKGGSSTPPGTIGGGSRDSG